MSNHLKPQKQLDNDTKLRLACCSFDRYIYQMFRVEITDRVLLTGLSVSDFINYYKRHGQHNIDFSKIYDLE
nr:hypothetical protein [uncultured Moraxella sp.]